MNYISRLHGIVITVGVVLSGQLFAAVPSAAMLGNTCAGCHGTQGNSLGPATPSIAGISSEYFIDAMAEYKSGERPATIMGRIARGYSEEEIALMAEFFSGQMMRPQSQEVEASLAKRGMGLHEKYCEKCHEDGGRSTEDDTAVLAGQWRPYLHYTMADFMEGRRDMPKKMKKRVEQLQREEGDEALNALLHYYASQQEGEADHD